MPLKGQLLLIKRLCLCVQIIRVFGRIRCLSKKHFQAKRNSDIYIRNIIFIYLLIKMEKSLKNVITNTKMKESVLNGSAATPPVV